MLVIIALVAAFFGIGGLGLFCEPLPGAYMECMTDHNEAIDRSRRTAAINESTSFDGRLPL